MRPSIGSIRLVACLALPIWLTAATAFGAGFGIFEQGNKAMGMAGAFTAQADDPSAMFHNVGGLAFQNERAFAAGFTLITSTQADFVGAAPFPGPNSVAQQDGLFEHPPHVYWVEPINDRLSFGLGLNVPFGLVSVWNSDEFAGRFLSFKGEMKTLDLTPNLGFRIGDRLGIGAGVMLRFSELELWRRIPVINPFTGQPDDIADLSLESDLESGVGFQIGVLHRATDRLSWGAAYRSQVEIDYSGDGRFEQIATGFAELDAAVALSLPFGRSLPIRTEIEFPDMATLGVAYQVSAGWLVEADVNWAGWDSVGRLPIDFTRDNEFDGELRQDWSNVYNYRIGAQWERSPGVQWRFGAVYDESPQPDENVSPLLPDADRLGLTFGHGRRLSRVTVDLAVMLLLFDDRTTLVNRDNFNGTYSTTGVLFGTTVGW